MFRYLSTLSNGVSFTLMYVRHIFWFHVWSNIGAFFIRHEAHRNMYISMFRSIKREGEITFENWFASLGTRQAVKACLRAYWQGICGGAWLGVGDNAPDFPVVCLNKDGSETESSFLALGRPNRPLVVIFGSST